MTQPLLEVKDLETSFPSSTETVRGRASVVEGVNLSIDAGEVLALVGESGCGKSVTALSILRLIPKPGRIERGEILLEGRDLRKLSIPEMRKVRGDEIAMIFQEPMTSLNPVVRVGDQVVEAIRLHEKVSRKVALARTLELFEKVSIPDAKARLRAFPHELSGGLKQRVMIAMALSSHPKLLIADEPTTALDVTVQAQTLELLRDLKQELDMAVLLITHDLGVVNQMADRVAVMYAGKVVEAGTREDVFRNAHHPYTKALLRSMPALATPQEPLYEISGSVPVPGEWPAGCRFVTRCEEGDDFCGEEPAPRRRLSDSHACWCHRVEEVKHESE
jgi:oligopeptide/dipeptide ABC transporter ATP-binding protein